jgi:uncharacterized membrane protein YcjF (UPF0283 family)
MSDNSLLDFFERAYFAELERKNKLYTAVAFPFSIVTVGVTLLGYASSKFEIERSYSGPVITLVVLTIFCLFSVVKNAHIFLVGREYEYIWQLDQMLSYRKQLEDFAASSELQFDARREFEDSLIRDIANCASINARHNDERSEAMYKMNLAAFGFVLLSLIAASIVVANELIS